MDANVSVASLTGEIDLHSASDLSTQLSDLIAAEPNVVLNLDGVGFLDSTGLGALVAARSDATGRGGELALVCTKQRLLKLFAITGLQDVFPFHDDVEGAVASLCA